MKDGLIIGTVVRMKDKAIMPKGFNVPPSMMVLTLFEGAEQVECVWAEGKETRRHWFSEDQLEVIEPMNPRGFISVNDLRSEIHHSEKVSRDFSASVGYGYLVRGISALAERASMEKS